MARSAWARAFGPIIEQVLPLLSRTTRSPGVRLGQLGRRFDAGQPAARDHDRALPRRAQALGQRQRARVVVVAEGVLAAAAAR